MIRFTHIEDEPCIYFDDESFCDTDRSEVRRCKGGLWQRGGYDSYMTDDEWESLESSDSRRLEGEYQRLVKSGEVEDIDARLERPRWIPVSERLPEDGDVVWCFDADGVGLCEYHGPLSGFQSYGASCDIEGLNSETLLGVTHWMELQHPEPPEVK